MNRGPRAQRRCNSRAGGVLAYPTEAVFGLGCETESLPAYVGVKGPQGYVIVRIESVQPGSAESKAMLATLPAELNQVWGRTEEQAVLKAMRTQAAVTMLPEAAEAISGKNEASN